jgi:Glycosyltransferase family 92
MRIFRKKPPFSKQLRIDPPAPRPDRHGVALVAVLKDEESYIDEWLGFHRAAGIRHFIMYDNGSTDRTVEIIKAKLPAGELTLLPWAGRPIDTANGAPFNIQAIAYAHAIINFGPSFRWMAFIDLDEFILPKQGKTIEEALDAVGRFPNVSLPWHMFGTNGHKEKPAGGVLRNYSRRASDPISRKKNATNFKCIVDPCEVTEVSIHHFETREHGSNTCNDAGQVFSRQERKRAAFYSAENLQLNHYYTRSLEEFARKLIKGPAGPTTPSRYQQRLRIAIESIESDVVEDRQIIEFLDRNNI